MTVLANLAKMTVTGTPGTGTFTLNAAVSGYLTFGQSGVVDGQAVTYGAVGAAGRETGAGVYTASGTTLSRSVLASTNSNALVNFGSDVLVSIGPAAEDFLDGLIGRVVTSGSQSTVTFSGLPQYFYTDLEFRVRGKGDAAAEGVNVAMRLNNDSGANYSYGGAFFTSTVSGYDSPTLGITDKFLFGVVPAANAVSGRSGGMIITVYNYLDTGLDKAVEFHGGYSIKNTAGQQGGVAGGGNYLSTSAITRADLFPSAGNWRDGTIISAYGRRG